ncbi:aminopeptidase N [Streptacidiphilus sp. PB12-B1b]|uniref:aminopeptidase N n=1 Tax=Streptacidiphilus sp. PB12-B1b TaxID=2705012 RepID=UPI0015FD9CAB|nr:aminopeptidase N [Streptacidiphilus sp. PB12-B1b]QMU75503.1 aminopeptidase N [Streptacidiphilus sp. PB12-B1b]
MPGTNLTRDEARERARILSVDSYDVRLDLRSAVLPIADGQGAGRFDSRTVLRFRCSEPGADSFADLLAPSVSRVVLNGVELDPAVVFDGARVALPGLAESNELVVEAACAYSRTGEGLHRFTDPVDGETYLYTQYEPADARRVFATFEQPDLKAPFSFTVVAPTHWTVFSNSPAGGDPVPVESGLSWSFAPTPRISSYITAVVAGPYHVARDHYSRVLEDGRRLEIPLGALCRASLASYFDSDEIFTVTKQGLDFFHEEFDYPYPFGKYDQAFVPEYNIGAMENPGLVTFREEYVFRSKVTEAAYEGRANVILHEMAHMWFGDLVTMQWWDDLWLKESFADFMGAFSQVAATKYGAGWITFANRRKAWAYRQDQLPTTHPITADIRDLEDAKLNFDGITYAKGASVLKQLVAYVGRDAFFEGARRYFKRHAYGNTTLTDLLAVLAETSGRGADAMAQWSSAWLQTAGVNALTPQLVTDAEGAITSFAVLQDAAASHPTLRPHRIAVGLYDHDEEGRLVRTHKVELDVAAAPRTEVPELVGVARPALVLVNDEDLTYCKIRFDEPSLTALRAGLGDLADPLARALAWSALWNLTRDGLMPARDYLGLVLGFAGRESDIGVLQSLHQQAKAALDLYVAPEHRAAWAAKLAEGALTELRAAAPGSDHQLAWARFLTQTATSETDLQLVSGLLAGTARIDGLAVDQELRWSLLHALASGGAATGAELEAELQRDDTASGKRQLTECQAALPEPQAKADTWRLVVDSDELPNALVEARISGFQQADQRELLEPYADRYFEVLEKVWAERSIEIAMRIVSGLFPRLVTTEETLTRTDEWLTTHEDAAPALRRLVLECRDDLARALHAQSTDTTN